MVIAGRSFGPFHHSTIGEFMRKISIVTAAAASLFIAPLASAQEPDAPAPKEEPAPAPAPAPSEEPTADPAPAPTDEPAPGDEPAPSEEPAPEPQA